MIHHTITAGMLSCTATPAYCRDNADKVKWFAWKIGWVKTIKVTDTVVYLEDRDSYLLKEVESYHENI